MKSLMWEPKMHPTHLLSYIFVNYFSFFSFVWVLYWIDVLRRGEGGTSSNNPGIIMIKEKIRN